MLAPCIPVFQSTLFDIVDLARFLNELLESIEAV